MFHPDSPEQIVTPNVPTSHYHIQFDPVRAPLIAAADIPAHRWLDLLQIKILGLPSICTKLPLLHLFSMPLEISQLSGVAHRKRRSGEHGPQDGSPESNAASAHHH